MKHEIRYQAAIVRDHHILLLKVWDHAGSGRIFWVIPGGMRMPDEPEEACVIREALEETHLHVGVERLIVDEPEEPNDFYLRAKTYLCHILGGEARPGLEPEIDTDVLNTIMDIGWFDLRDTSRWDTLALNDPITSRKLRLVRSALGYSP